MKSKNALSSTKILIIGTLLALKSEYMVFGFSGEIGQTGICREIKWDWTTRFGSYIETFKKRRWFVMRTYTRINYQVQHVRSSRMVLECCDGYQQLDWGTTMTCKPKCMPRCGLHEICYEPNKCRCDTGYVRPESYLTNVAQECNPVCMPECINGVCVKPDLCVCHPGYEQDSIEKYVCNAICDNDCINGHCIGPNECRCNVGYEQKPIDPPHICSAICNPGCVNAKCTKPNNCECDIGFEKNLNGPMEVCLPSCEPACVNSICIQPGKCECNKGYATSQNNSSNVCSPVCDPFCVNADCIGPNHCECHKGYQMSSNDSGNICLPICNPSCVNSTCSEPDYCKCVNGYTRKLDDPMHVCSPVCNPPCVNSDCTRPDHCDCHEGYDKISVSSAHECLPVCNQSCVNAVCYKPNVCKCYTGYEQSPNDPNSCWPVCDPPCGLNSSCTSPNQCTCNVGYIEGNSSNVHFENSTLSNIVVCHPLCDPPCHENAICLSPNFCQCNHGYLSTALHNEESSPTKCLPICEKDCVNGICGYPNKCICDSGFELSPDDDFVCVPHCEQDCINANCTKPNYCECFDDYEKPTRMDPYENQTTAENVCVPICPKECAVNGCITPNQCLCRTGYVFKDSTNDLQRHFCQPVCKPECSNGLECIAPNQCESLFKNHEDESQPNPNEPKQAPFDNPNSQHCSNTSNFQIQNGTCVCNDGWAGPKCDLLSFCIIRFVADKSNEYSISLSDILERNSSEDTDYKETTDRTFGWKAPECNERCRTAVFSNAETNVTDKIMHCHQLLLNASSNYENPENQSATANTKNGTILCFIKAELECSSLEMQAMTHYETYQLYGALGIGVLTTTVIAVSLIVCIVWRRRKNVNSTHAGSRSNIVIAEWTDDSDPTNNTTT